MVIGYINGIDGFILIINYIYMCTCLTNTIPNIKSTKLLIHIFQIQSMWYYIRLELLNTIPPKWFYRSRVVLKINLIKMIGQCKIFKTMVFGLIKLDTLTYWMSFRNVLFFNLFIFKKLFEYLRFYHFLIHNALLCNVIIC